MKTYEPLLRTAPGKIAEIFDAALKSGLSVSFEPVFEPGFGLRPPSQEACAHRAHPGSGTRNRSCEGYPCCPRCPRCFSGVFRGGRLPLPLQARLRRRLRARLPRALPRARPAALWLMPLRRLPRRWRLARESAAAAAETAAKAASAASAAGQRRMGPWRCTMGSSAMGAT